MYANGMMLTKYSVASESDVVRVLLIDDDEDDALIAKSLLSDICGITFEVDWVSSYDGIHTHFTQNQHHICLLDYCLGSCTGLDVLGEVLQYGCRMPIIMMTGTADREIDQKSDKAWCS